MVSLYPLLPDVPSGIRNIKYKAGLQPVFIVLLLNELY